MVAKCAANCTAVQRAGSDTQAREPVPAPWRAISEQEGDRQRTGRSGDFRGTLDSLITIVNGGTCALDCRPRGKEATTLQYCNRKTQEEESTHG